MPELLKRGFDLVVATTALALGAPLLGLIATAVRLDSPGPVLFRQQRVGRGRKLIETIKFRTMTTDAERIGPQVTATNDRRVTRVGRWLRKTKLDELPQLWNVVRGDMSLVGPRPEVPRYVAIYRREWDRLFEVRPGLTDLASLSFRNEEELLGVACDHERAYREVVMPLKLGLALEGVERSSFRHDLTMILLTVRSVVSGQSRASAAILAEARRQIEAMNNLRSS